MIITCKECFTKNDVFEIFELKDTKTFSERTLFLSICTKCNSYYAMLTECRILDNKVFINNLSGDKLLKFIKREGKNLKAKISKRDDFRFYGWVYGVNKERKNNKGKVTSIKQYSCDYRTNNKKLEKFIKL